MTFFNERVPFIRCLSHPLYESNSEGKTIHNLDQNNFIYLQEKDSIFEPYKIPPFEEKFSQVSTITH